MMYLTATSINTMVYIGMVILVGVVVNNAIVLVDLINRLRAEGFGRLEATLEAGKQRFRPILMTSLTTIFGLIPMSMGQEYSALGKTLVGGLLTSTFLTLFVVPLFYSFLDDLRQLASHMASTALRGHASPQEHPR